MKNHATKRAAILTRVSTREQAESGTSLQTQKKACREYAMLNNYEVIDNYVIIEDHTGTDLERLGIKKLLSGASQGLFDVVIIYTLDRLYRPKEEGDEWRMLELVDRFKKLGVSIEFVTGGIPTEGPFASMFSMFESWRAGEERRKLIERTQRGRKARIAEGKYLFIPPFGYTKDRDGALVIDEEQAEVVRHIYHLYDAERMGLRKVQVRLTGAVQAPAGGHVWSQNTIWKILTSACYWSGKHSSSVPCPPIIDEKQAMRVSRRLSANKQFKPSNKPDWPLQGRIRCCCGGSWRTEKAKPGKGRDTYYCRNRLKTSFRALSTGQVCTVPRMRRDEMEFAVAKGLFGALESPEALARAVEASISQLRTSFDEIGQEVVEIDGAVAEVDSRLREIDRARIRGRIPTEELDRDEEEALKMRSELFRRLDAYDPASLLELERARETLRNAEVLSTWASQYGRYQKVNIGGIKGYVPYGEPPVDREVAMLFAVGMPDWFRSQPEIPISETEAIRAFVNMLDRLHAEVLVHPSKLEIRGTVPIEVPTGDDAPPHASMVSRGSG